MKHRPNGYEQSCVCGSMDIGLCIQAMEEEAEQNRLRLPIVPCPKCFGSGYVELRLLSKAEELPEEAGGFATCPACEGVRVVFVIPARVVGPAKA